MTDRTTEWLVAIRSFSACVTDVNQGIRGIDDGFTGQNSLGDPKANKTHAQYIANEVSSTVIGLMLAVSKHRPGNLSTADIDSIASALEEVCPGKKRWRPVLQMYLEDPQSEQDRYAQETLLDADKGSLVVVARCDATDPLGDPEPVDPEAIEWREFLSRMTLWYVAGAFRLAQCFFESSQESSPSLRYEPQLIPLFEDYCAFLLRAVVLRGQSQLVSPWGHAFASAIAALPAGPGGGEAFESVMGGLASACLADIVAEFEPKIQELAAADGAYALGDPVAGAAAQTGLGWAGLTRRQKRGAVVLVALVVLGFAGSFGSDTIGDRSPRNDPNDGVIDQEDACNGLLIAANRQSDPSFKEGLMNQYNQNCR